MTADASEKYLSVVLSVLLIASVLAAGLLVSPAAATASGLTVTEAAIQSDGTIEVSGTVSNTGDVSFLIQDPADGDVATVPKSVTNTDFSVNIDLSGAGFSGGDGELDEGEAIIQAQEASSFTSAETSTTFTVDDTKPSGGVDSPTDGADLNEHPTIEGTASDDTGVDSVELTIQNDAGDYWNGGSWVTSETTVPASGTNSWTYDTGNTGISTDGTYEVSIQVTDTAGNTWEKVVPHPDAETTKVSYAVDATAPTITSTSLSTDTNDDTTVEEGDVVTVEAEVSDATSGVDSVTVDASPLGGDASETLSVDSGDTYTTSFKVENPNTGDGSVNLDVTAKDKFGNENTATESIDLETGIANVDSLSVDHDFAGVVKDESTLKVTASGITDSRGNTITGPTNVDISIGGKTVKTTQVTSGTLEADIDTANKLSDSAATGDATVAIVQANAGEATDTVELVHEAKDLKQGYQVQGTPMPLAKDPVVENVVDVTTYDPTVEGNQNEWVSPDAQAAGEGYYVEGENDNARIGYVFDTSASEGVEAETLHEGFNLIGTSVDLSKTDKHSINADLGGATDVSDGNVEAWVRDSSVSLDQSSNTAAYNEETDGTTDVSSYEAYFVYIDDGTEVRNIDILSYDTADRN